MKYERTFVTRLNKVFAMGLHAHAESSLLTPRLAIFGSSQRCAFDAPRHAIIASICMVDRLANVSSKKTIENVRLTLNFDQPEIPLARTQAVAAYEVCRRN
jgi:hypothetical protein